MIDIDAVRADTPACAGSTYFNNAGASFMPRPVIAALHDHIDREARVGSKAAALAVQDRLEDAYRSAARLLGCAADEIAFVESHSRGWQAALGALSFGPGERILVGRSEWGGNYASFLKLAALTGVAIETVPSEETGEISLSALAAMIDDRVRLISLTWVGANGGLVHPAAGVGAIARAAGIPFLLDASQAVGQLPADVGEIGCDVLTTPGRKWLRGPSGSGLLYIRRAFLDGMEPALLDHMSAPLVAEGYAVRSGARRFEASNFSTAGRLGLGVAIDYARALGIDRIGAGIAATAATLRARLNDIPGVTVRDLGRSRAGLVSFTLDRHDPQRVQAALHRQGVEVAVNGAAYTPLDMQARGLSEIVRASVHCYTDTNDLDRLVAAVHRLAHE